MSFFTHVWIRVPEYDENLCFTGYYWDLQFTADFSLLGGKSNYNIDPPFPFAWPIYHDRESTPQENRDLLQLWRTLSEEQPSGNGHGYDPFINNCWNNVIDMQGMF